MLQKSAGLGGALSHQLLGQYDPRVRAADVIDAVTDERVERTSQGISIREHAQDGLRACVDPNPGVYLTHKGRSFDDA